MGELFPNYIIDLEKCTVYSKYKEKYIGNGIDKKGYCRCYAVDAYGNMYYGLHEILFAEHRQFPKHLWPIDENGKRYEIDHKNTNKTDNRVENLRLVSHEDNMNNKNTKKTFKGKHNSPNTEFKKGCTPWNKGINNSHNTKQIAQYTLDGKLVKIWNSGSDATKAGFKHVSDCCNGRRKTDKGYIWKFI